MNCPRCGHEQPEASECVRCGVVFARARPVDRSARPRQRPRVVVRPQGGRTRVVVIAVAATMVGALAWLRTSRPPAEALPAPPVPPVGPPTSRAPEVSPIEPRPTAEPTAAPVVATRPQAGDERLTIPPPLAPASPESVTMAEILDLEIRWSLDSENVGLSRHLATAYAAMGERHRRAGELDQAVSFFERALIRVVDHDEAALGLAAALLARGQPARARSALERVGPERRRTFAYLVVVGDVAYEEERLEDALSAWRAARSVDPRQGLDERIARVERELGAQEGVRSVQSRRFRVYFEGGENVAVGRLVLDALERAYSELRHKFDIPDFTVTTVLYTRQDYSSVTRAPHWSGAAYDGKIRLPVGALRTIDARYRQTIQHELVHAFVRRKAGARVPRWLNEGLAQHFSGRRSTDYRLGPAEREIASGPLQPGDPRLFYAQSVVRVEFMMARWGRRKMLALLAKLGDRSFEEALRDVYRTTPERLFQDLASRSR